MEKINQKGMSILEVMVSVSILILIISIAVAVLTQMGINSRDSVRVYDIQAVERALAVYFQQNNSYPSTGNQWYGTCAELPCHGDWGVGTEEWVPGMPGEIMARLPLDPNPDGCSRCYLYRSNGIDYKILAHKPEDAENEKFLMFIDPSRDGGDDPCVLELDIPPNRHPWAWSVYSAGARCW